MKAFILWITVAVILLIRTEADFSFCPDCGNPPPDVVAPLPMAFFDPNSMFYPQVISPNQGHGIPDPANCFQFYLTLLNPTTFNVTLEWKEGDEWNNVTYTRTQTNGSGELPLIGDAGLTNDARIIYNNKKGLISTFICLNDPATGACTWNWRISKFNKETVKQKKTDKVLRKLVKMGVNITGAYHVPRDNC
jgi:hypothetical protein